MPEEENMYRKKLRSFLKDSVNQKRYAKWIFEYSKQYIWHIVGLILINIALSLISIGSSVASKYVVDLASSSKGLTIGIIMMVALTAFSLLLSVALSICTTIVNEKYSFSIRLKLYDNILKTKWPKLASYKAGDLITRMTSDINAVTSGITSTAPDILTLSIQLVIAFIVLFYYDAGLALFALISAPVAVLTSIIMAAKLKKLQVKVQESESAYNAFLHESMDNLLVIKSFANEEESSRKFSELRRERFYWVMKRSRMSIMTNMVLSLAFSIGYLVAFTTGAVKISQGLITFGTMTLFLSMVRQIQTPIVGLGRTIPSLVSVLASAGRLIEVSDLEKEERIIEGPIPKGVGIKFRDVSFKYLDDFILQDVNFDINQGDTVAITGRTGAGKTTLIKLLMNFIEPTQGEVLYSDQNNVLSKANAGSREFIGYIPQGNYLFSGTIADNLRVGKTDATVEEINEALRCACADEFVNAMKDGINTIIGERGEGLSEGQGQRIALARAFIRKSPLLILDESTSALDEMTEYKILECIKNMAYKPTCVIITHRKAAISICNRHIRVLDNSVIEVGTDA
jgi:ABC-type multidrug transport system fused ATPase/permease subunit